jgi:hypothetical protein
MGSFHVPYNLSDLPQSSPGLAYSHCLPGCDLNTPVTSMAGRGFFDERDGRRRYGIAATVSQGT